MENNKILLGVTGGIAAYKAIDLASGLVKEGFEVRCILTANALKFVAPASFEAITKNSVHSEMFGGTDPIPHISLADWADLTVVAPATANIMAKVAHGVADDLLSTTLLAHTKPVLFVPAMNVHMWESAATSDNVEILKKRGHQVLLPDKGMLACGYEGRGKYPPNAEIRAAIHTYLHHVRDLDGLKALVTAGATVEPLDPMRYISNRSSGKMGVALARALALRGAQVTLVYGKLETDIPHYLEEAVFAESAEAMYQAVMSRFEDMDWIIKCAAVADFAPEDYSPAKLPKANLLELKLAATPDILSELGKRKLTGQKLVGFAAQSDDLLVKALEKFRNKSLDMVCVNDIAVVGSENSNIAVVGKFTGKPVLAEDRDLNVIELSGSKLSVAHGILDLLKTL